MKVKRATPGPQLNSYGFPPAPHSTDVPAVRALFRVDAGPHIGLGHLQRCLSLATALHQLGATCIFLTNGDPTVQNRIAAHGFEPIRLDGVETGGAVDLKQTLDTVTRYPCDAVVVDSYHVDADYLGRLRAMGLFTVAIDDLARYLFPCQLVVNGGAHAHQLAYRSSSGDTRFLLGPRYALLRPEFWDVPPRVVRDTVQNILVTLGGADPHNLMPQLLRLLDDLPGDFTMTAIVGPFFQNRAEVEYAARNCRRSVGLVDAPDSVRDLMLEADLAISAGGQTLYELAATGTPTVAVQVAQNQAASSHALAKEGVVRVAGRVGEVELIGRIKDEVCVLMASRDARVAMCKAAQRLVDRQGAVTVAELMCFDEQAEGRSK